MLQNTWTCVGGLGLSLTWTNRHQIESFSKYIGSIWLSKPWVTHMTLLSDNLACSVGGWLFVCVCVQFCCHLLSRPDKVDSGSRISWRQTAECVAPGFRFRVQGPNLLSAHYFLDSCLLRFHSDEGHADTLRAPRLLSHTKLVTFSQWYSFDTQFGCCGARKCAENNN